MNIHKFEKEVAKLLATHYNGTEKMSENNWFSVAIHSVFKQKTLQLTIFGIDTNGIDKYIDGCANNYSELFIGVLYLTKEYLDSTTYTNKKCNSCKGIGTYEEYGGSGHSWTTKCDTCNGTGKPLTKGE